MEEVAYPYPEDYSNARFVDRLKTLLLFFDAVGAVQTQAQQLGADQAEPEIIERPVDQHLLRFWDTSTFDGVLETRSTLWDVTSSLNGRLQAANGARGGRLGLQMARGRSRRPGIRQGDDHKTRPPLRLADCAGSTPPLQPDPRRGSRSWSPVHTCNFCGRQLRGLSVSTYSQSPSNPLACLDS